MTASTLYFVIQSGSDGKPYTRECNPEMSFDELCADVWDGQFEDVVDIIAVKLETFSACYIRLDVYAALSDRSFKECREPYHELADEIERHVGEVYRTPRASVHDHYRPAICA